MVLSQPDIIQALNSGELRFSPEIEPGAVKQCSVDLRLSNEFTTFKPQPDHVAAIRIRQSLFRGATATDLWDSRLEDFHTLDPGAFVLAKTHERVTLGPGLMGYIEGRSSWARFGIGIHATAPKIDPGYDNKITLEMTNHGKVRVELCAVTDTPCQLILFRLSQPLDESALYGTVGTGLFQGKQT